MISDSFIIYVDFSTQILPNQILKKCQKFANLIEKLKLYENQNLTPYFFFQPENSQN
jgi:hypothetical protein